MKKVQGIDLEAVLLYAVRLSLVNKMVVQNSKGVPGTTRAALLPPLAKGGTIIASHIIRSAT